MAKAGKYGWDRCSHGTIRRETDTEANPVVYGKGKVLNGFICAQSKDQLRLGERLDEMVLLVLDFNLQLYTGKTSVVAGMSYFMN